MKVIITNDSLDSLLSVQISTNGGQSYSTYSVSSLKDGLTFDCSPKDLKVICDVNTLKYIQVLADGEKAASSDIDLSNYIKIKDIYVDVYKNPYYGKSFDDGSEMPDGLDGALIQNKNYKFYCEGEGFDPAYWNSAMKIAKDDYNYYSLDNFIDTYIENKYSVYMMSSFDEGLLDCDLRIESAYSYLWDGYSFYTNARVHFIKHF